MLLEAYFKKEVEYYGPVPSRSPALATAEDGMPLHLFPLGRMKPQRPRQLQRDEEEAAI